MADIYYNEVYWDPGKGKLIADPVITKIPSVLQLSYSQDIVYSKCSIDLRKKRKICCKKCT